MRLGRIAKFNMMIAILLCMAFVVNLGATFALTSYKFNAGSINTVSGQTNHDTYTNFASMQATTGKYTYSPGVSNNQLSINYSLNQSHDIMIRFTATYSGTGFVNKTHIANDFALNIVNRDNWIVDMGSTADWVAGDPNPTYYNLTSTTNTLSGVMYYMGTLADSGTLPVISGVTFYTSPNNSYEYIGDTLTVTLTPVYVRTNSANYTEETDISTTKHSFYSSVAQNGFTQNKTLFNNWVTYMAQKGDGTVATNASYMIYNAYVDNARSLQYPYDTSVISDGDVNSALTEQPTYSNTAYRYQINTVTENDKTTTTRTYNAITAGNKYYGGLGVYVIPNSSLVTVGIAVNYFWQKNNVIAGTAPTDVVTLQYSSDIQTITNGNTSYHYYKADINKPTYVNVLDYIMLTAENYSTIISNGYSLILNNITVSLENSSISGWSGVGSVESYDIHNSTHSSPILARVQDVVIAPKTYDANISITNNKTTPIKIAGFTVSSELWYAKYTTTGEGESAITTFKKSNFTVTNDQTQQVSTVCLQADGLVYDTTLWDVEAINGVFTFTSKSNATYIPSGYTMVLVSGVKVPLTSACQTATEANDFWCSLEVSNVSTATATYTTGSTTGVETIVEGYYTEITSSNPGKVYIRNNTSQIITGISLATLSVKSISTDAEYGDYLPRDKWTGDATYNLTEHLAGEISIKPNEMVLAYTITPKDGVDKDGNPVSVPAVIYDIKINATLTTSKENDDLDLIYNESTKKGVIINDSTSDYEFRLVSTSDLSGVLTNPNNFVAHQNGTKYYYYYKGIICANMSVEIFKGFASNVVVDELVHLESSGVERYQYLTDGKADATKLALVVSNFADTEADVENGIGAIARWGITQADIVIRQEGADVYQWFATWLNAMNKLYDAPSDADRTASQVVTKCVNQIVTYDKRFTIVPVNVATLQVDDGESFTFTIQLKAGYKLGATVVVSANGVELTANSGEYTIDSVTAKTEITVSGIETDN